MKNIIAKFTALFIFIALNFTTTFAQEVAQDESQQDEFNYSLIKNAKFFQPQLGVSLRSNAFNINYKQELGKNTLFRASLRIPNISISQSRNGEFFTVRNLGVALGFEKNIKTSRLFDIYGGAELSSILDVNGQFARTTFLIQAIVGLAAKVSDNISAFVEVQPGIVLHGRNNFQEKFFRSSRTLNIGIMWQLNTSVLMSSRG